ncbi:TVP38/TMEM64 family protein [Leisingera aquaemixtae]|uniref:TVP38/TMEM64 family membrane protein n=1 Tax=Leisingera aquaemixtae TaxID=1396826 RepID=A0A0P1H620_9RHOB|nr:TVP38/TMEM64 family protein [Leisingera aquaemixtae]CUH98366.1 TVP38/TMEM64 family inner membrane protein YdjZ [Leisingera aquaemixtae]
MLRTGRLPDFRRRHRSVLAVVAVALLLVLVLWRADALPPAMTRADITAWVDAAGILGPLVIVGLMTMAIVASPLPSAPVAVAAGAVYGHVLGTGLVALGAELGAIIAFLIARRLGRSAIQRYLGAKLETGLMGSQNALMLTVFGSRLLPFVSFDLISYAAGLTALRFWRFALATAAGILPASFILAHLGSELVGPDGPSAIWAVLGLGLLTGAPLLWAAWKREQGG